MFLQNFSPINKSLVQYNIHFTQSKTFKIHRVLHTHQGVKFVLAIFQPRYFNFIYMDRKETFPKLFSKIKRGNRQAGKVLKLLLQP